MSEHHTGQTGEFLALLPLKNVVILPRSLTPIVVGRPPSIKAVEYALRSNKTVFITAQRHPDIENPAEGDLFSQGTRAVILQVMRLPKGALKIIVEGISRATFSTTESVDGFLGAWCTDVATEGLEKAVEIEALWRSVQNLYGVYTKHNPKAPTDIIGLAKSVEDIDVLVDTLAVHINLSFDERQMILETADLEQRLLKVISLLRKEIDIIETEERIRGRVQTQLEKSQREYYLTEQIKAIQKELGREDTQGEVSQLYHKVKNLGLSPEALEKVEKEIKRLEQMPALSSEAVVSRHYVDWILSLPWKKISRDSISLDEAEKILNKNHAGLKKVKERIIEFLAAKKFSQKLERAPIICLVGPPGVGKTSLAHSIADSLGREFVRISLGGVRDEAEIRGHRRTYIGALPGKLIQAMRKAKTMNPVILLDEIDKMTSDISGDPAAALLEVLDPEQNKSFVDHFLEVEYDLSKVMFITTANHIEGIPYPLFDRMEIITISGYTDAEKTAIAQNFLIPKSLKEYGLKARQFMLSQPVLEKIITLYTKEAGVRQLERLLAKLMRKVIQKLLGEKKSGTVTVSDELVREWLGHPKYRKTPFDTAHPRIGLATGLAWTELGGDILEIETAILPGKGGVTLTGQLGEIMQESAHAALSYVRFRAEKLGLKKSFNASRDIHIHIPEGATPKDGPSAGITMCTALVSALTKNPVRADRAMTGEITLSGRVLGVGGLKEKILAARQQGILTIVVPKENADDIEECLKEIGNDVTIIFVETMDEVLKHMLVNDPFAPEIAQKRTRRPSVRPAEPLATPVA